MLERYIYSICVIYTREDESNMIRKVWKVGNSLVFALPTELAKVKGIKEGDYVSIPDDQIERAQTPPVVDAEH